MKQKSPMAYVIAGIVILLLAVHQDFWNWDNDSLVLGFLPVGLFYHACISIAAGFTWYLATIFAWPVDLAEDEADTQGKGE
ncbi:MAG: hypothetical protein ACI9G1_004342 [Pirellulaceae bacterium]|jgi:hypothetical protein